MKTYFFKITTIALILAGCISCKEKMNDGNEDSIDDNKDFTEYLYRLPSSEKRDIIKTFKDEPGFITWRTDPAADRIWYYYFEPAAPDNKFSKRLHFWTAVGKSDVDLDKYVSPNNDIKVKVSGNVTNSLSLHIEWNPDCDCGFATYEFNILEVSSIKK